MTISETTKKKYMYIINKLNLSKEEINKPLIIKKKINEITSNKGTKKNYLSAILYKYNNELNEQTYKYLKNMISTLNTEQKNIDDENIMTPAQIEKKIEWPEVIKLLNKLEDETDKAILSVYVLIPPRRVLDYSNMYIMKPYKKSHLTDKNYFVNIKEPYFLFYDYKTKKYYKDKKINIPADLNKILNEYLKLNKLKNNDKLFNFNILKKIKKIFKNHLKKNIDINSIRHSYINELSKNNNLTVKERKVAADLMGHNVSTQLLYQKYK